jgi:outer membrane protein OmpA-like peptidoglycan-associated protein
VEGHTNNEASADFVVGDGLVDEGVGITPQRLSELRADTVCDGLARCADGSGEADVPDRQGDGGTLRHLSGDDLRPFLFPIGVGGQRHKTKATNTSYAVKNRRVEVHFLDLT